MGHAGPDRGMSAPVFGDADPEDSWDAGDDVGHKIAILVRILLGVALEHAEPGHNRVRALVRLGFATSAVEELRAVTGEPTRPILDALDLGFFYLTVAEGASGG